MKKKIYFKQAKQPRGRFSEAEKTKILQEFDNQVRLRTRTIPEIISSLGASPATIYRWRERRLNGIAPRSNHDYSRQIEQAIHILCQHHFADRIAYTEALFQFIVWMRWPNRPDYMQMGMAAFLSAYYSNGDPRQCLSDVDDEVAKRLCRYIRLRDIGMLCCEAPVDIPLFARHGIDGNRIDDGDVVATVAWVLINVGKNEFRPRKSASLSKAFYLIQEGVLDVNWIVGRRQLDKLWGDSAAAAPFLYVERYDSPLLFSLSPVQPDLKDYVDDLISRPADVRCFFGRSRAAADLITGVLDPRALKTVRFPTIPIENGMAGYSLKKYALRQTIEAAISNYGRSSKYLR